MLEQADKISDKPPLKLQEIFDVIYKMKRIRKRNENKGRPLEIYFPNKLARDRFFAAVSRMKP